MGDSHLFKPLPLKLLGMLQRFLQGPQHQGQRRPEFVADIGEEGGFGAIDFGERFGAAAFLLISLGVGNRRSDLPGDQLR